MLHGKERMLRFSHDMEALVEAYLSLLCEMCGADYSHLLVWYENPDERLVLLEQRHRQGAKNEKQYLVDPQIPFSLAARGIQRGGSAEGEADHREGEPAIRANRRNDSSKVGATHRDDSSTIGATHRDDIPPVGAVQGDYDAISSGPRHGGGYAFMSWPGSIFGESCFSRWNLTPRFDSREWLFRGSLNGLFVELQLLLPGPHCGYVLRRLDTALAFLHLLETLLPHLDLFTVHAQRHELGGYADFDPPLVGMSSAMRDLRHQIRAAADAAIPVLIEGESGTGKEIVARNLHRLSHRRARPLVIVNCMELPETLLQTELFGHLKGAFTGASRDRMGLVESANRGTLFLDEIGEMPLTQQAALLRVLQEGEVRRIGDSMRRPVDVRFVFATNRDLADRVRQGRFREDLFFRVNGVRLFIPPLRQRKEDIPLLVRHFIEMSAMRGNSGASVRGGAGTSVVGSDGATANGCVEIRLSSDVIQRMLAYHWPGNVRELRNEIERIVTLNRGVKRIRLEMLSPRIREASRGGWRGVGGTGDTLPAATERLERHMIIDALGRYDGNRTQTAAALGITRQGLLKKMKRHRIV